MKIFFGQSFVRAISVVLGAITSFAASSEVLYNAPLVPLYELRGNAARVTYPELLVNEYRNSYYTTDPATRDLLLSRGWVGGAVFAHVAGLQGAATTVPDVGMVKGLRRTFGAAPRSEHFYTTDQADVNVVVPNYGYTYEGQSGGLFTSEILGTGMIPLNRVWKDWGAGKAEHRFIRGVSKGQTQSYLSSKQYFVDTQSYIDDRIEGYAVATDATSAFPQDWGVPTPMCSPHCGMRTGSVAETLAVCADVVSGCDEVLGTGMVCGGIVRYYDQATRELVATQADFAYGLIPAAANSAAPRFGCRTVVPDLRLSYKGFGPNVRIEFSGYSVVFSTPDGGATTRVVSAETYFAYGSFFF